MIAHGEVLSRPMQRVVCSRRVSLSSESVFNCDEQCVLPLTYVISNDDVKTENEHIHSASVSDQQRQSMSMAYQLVADVVANMVSDDRKVTLLLCSRHSATLVRVVNAMSSKHAVVFKNIARTFELQLNGRRDVEVCRTTFAGVVDKVFADGCYNWGRIVTVFAYAGWLACAFKTAGVDVSQAWSNIVVDVAAEYIDRKFSHWICMQGGWDAMDNFFAQPVPCETKYWHGLLCCVCLCVLTIIVTLVS